MLRRLSILRGLAILAVVCNHATGWGFTAMFWWPHRYRATLSPNYEQLGSLQYYILTIINQLALFSVPAFLLISGFFVAYAAGRSLPTLRWKIVRVRLLNLWWPYLIWSIVVFIGDGLLGAMYTPKQYLMKLVLGGATPAYFFVPLLGQFYILSPIIVRWAKSRPILLLTISALLQLALASLPYIKDAAGYSATLQSILKSWLFIRWQLFFVLGVVIGFHPRQAVDWLARHRRDLLAAAISLGVFSVVECQMLLHTPSDWNRAYDLNKLSSVLYAVAFILMFLAWGMQHSAYDRAMMRIGSMSYGIYLIHPLALIYLSKFLYHVAPWVLAHQVLMVLLLVSASVGGISLFMTGVARSPARRIYRYLFG